MSLSKTLELEHFDERDKVRRGRSTRTKRDDSTAGSGPSSRGSSLVPSPAHSTNCSYYRTRTLQALTSEKRAKKVRFYRNGDRYFKGLVFAVSSDRFRSYDALLMELTKSLADNLHLPQGVRNIYTIDGSKKITSMDELVEGKLHVLTPQRAALSGGQRAALEAPKSRSGGPKEPIEFDPFMTFFSIDSLKYHLIEYLVSILLLISSSISFDTFDNASVCIIYLTCLQDFFGDDDVFMACGAEKFRYAQDDFVLTHSGKTPAFLSDKTNHLTTRSPWRQAKPPEKLRNVPFNECVLIETQSSAKTRSSPGILELSPIVSTNFTCSFCVCFVSVNGNLLISSSMINEKYKVGKVIGDGNFAVVKECVERATGQEYALKIIDKARCSGKEHLIENEVAVLRRVRHPSIIQLIEVDETPTQLFLVMELVKGGDLFDAITSSTKYSERDASAMVFNLAGAVKYLHRMNIVHRDIKPENLLVCEYPDGTKSLKLGDFGLATVVEGPLFTVCGTPTYVAPEIIAETGYGLKVDIWAAGVITYILLCGFPPFRSENNVQEELFDQILRGKLEFPSPDWDNISLPAKMLISQMLQVNVDARFTAEEVLSHPWVTVKSHKSEHHNNTTTSVYQESLHLWSRNTTTTATMVLLLLNTLNVQL
uniref:non-specific serine/threonine protein kinase n=1 Tax=Periophthalmus magnuspinnatus TaxID=409849 RepID=A0A3B4AUE6_9GOBI